MEGLVNKTKISFLKGDVIVLPFPFSNLLQSKKRPALVVANLKSEDIILAQITSGLKVDDYSIILSDSDFKQGKLNLTSMIRPDRLFTADRSIILYKIGSLKDIKVREVEKKLLNIFTE